MRKPVVVIQGASGPDELPGLEKIASDAEFRFTKTTQELREAILGADVLFAWNFKESRLQDVWDQAASLKWIHWGGAGVNAALFPELVKSSVRLSNCRGIFDRAMAEYTLGMMLVMAKGLDKVLDDQRATRWQYRMSETIENKNALLVGAGSIGRTIGRLLKANGLNIRAVGRSAREFDEDFDTFTATESLHQELPWADYVILVTPLTAETRGLFGTQQFAQMKTTARFINVGRGPCVNENDLIKALQSNKIAGAALDVYESEPLPESSPLWKLPNVFVSPHISGDFFEVDLVMVNKFLENFKRYKSNHPLLNLVDKKLGY
ncbi:MAG: D-2-hydroxyacid dehydrogenase [Arenicellales bacterium WSBS_2016_MAG_OTU3]